MFVSISSSELTPNVVVARYVQYSICMALIGPRSLQVLVQGLIIPTPIIVKLCAYPRHDGRGQQHLAVHIISDDGTCDTIVKKLCDRIRANFVAAYKHECTHGLERFKFVHTDRETANIPSGAQLIYLRPTS